MGLAMNKIEIPFGREFLEVRVPPGCKPHILRKQPMPLLPDPKVAVQQALQSPVSCPTIGELAKNNPTVCIVICDITRPVPNGLVLPQLVRALLDSGVALEKITILVATGLHRPNLGDELLELIGDQWVFDNVRIENHDARDSASMIRLGETPSDKIPIILNRRIVESQLRIVTGLVEPHFMAGYSGGRKVIAPGVAGEETIRTFHNYRFMSDAKATNCNLDGNPLHRGQLEILQALGPVFAVNTIIDEQRKLSFVNFGECQASHLQAVNFVRQYAEIPVDRKFATVVTSAAGYPLDKTYYQTVKGMVGPIQILKHSGTLIIASACEEGLGSAEFRESQMSLILKGTSGFLDSIRNKPLADIDGWQSQMQTRATSVGRVQLYSPSLSELDRQATGVEMIDSVEQAIAASIAKSQDPHVAFIPEGPYVIPVQK
jgi:lactate racemase